MATSLLPPSNEGNASLPVDIATDRLRRSRRSKHSWTYMSANVAHVGERQRGEQGSSIGLWYTRNSLI